MGGLDPEGGQVLSWRNPHHSAEHADEMPWGNAGLLGQFRDGRGFLD